MEVSTNEFSKFTTKMNNGNGVLSKVVSDETLGAKVDSTMANLETGSKQLNEIMEAAKHNFLLRGYFNKKNKAEENKEDEDEKEIQQELDKQEKLDKEDELKKELEPKNK